MKEYEIRLEVVKLVIENSMHFSGDNLVEVAKEFVDFIMGKEKTNEKKEDNSTN